MNSYYKKNKRGNQVKKNKTLKIWNCLNQQIQAKHIAVDHGN